MRYTRHDTIIGLPSHYSKITAFWIHVHSLTNVRDRTETSILLLKKLVPQHSCKVYPWKCIRISWWLNKIKIKGKQLKLENSIYLFTTNPQLPHRRVSPSLSGSPAAAIRSLSVSLDIRWSSDSLTDRPSILHIKYSGLKLT